MKDLTTKEFWQSYWADKIFISKILPNFSFYKLFNDILGKKNYETMIEVGGFPGNYAIYFKKYFNYSPTLLDYVIDDKVISKLLKINGLNKYDLEVIEADFFKYNCKKKYDVVFSLGFIEHFEDTFDVIKRHWDMVAKNGTMIIGLPNFLGMNGIYQLIFDPSNLNVHNLDSMNISTLRKIAKSLKPKKFEIIYHSGALVWLEKLTLRPLLLRLLTYALNSLGMILVRLNIRNKFTSTHIFIIAEK